MQFFGSGLICPRAQITPLPTLANQILARTFFSSVTHSFAYPAVGKFSRASSAGGRLNLRSNSEQPDRVGRRGLSEPREDFSRLNTYAFPWLYPWLDSVSHSFAYPAAGKFSRASSAGGRRNLRSNIEQPDRVGRRGLSEPREDFSQLITYAFPWRCLFTSRIRLRIQPLESSLGRVPQAAD